MILVSPSNLHIYGQTWSRLERMSFLPIAVRITTLNDVGSSDHSPICVREVSNYSVDMYKVLLVKSPLRFNSFLLLHSLFDALMKQIFMNFSQ